MGSHTTKLARHVLDEVSCWHTGTDEERVRLAISEMEEAMQHLRLVEAQIRLAHLYEKANCKLHTAQVAVSITLGIARAPIKPSWCKYCLTHGHVIEACMLKNVDRRKR